METYTHLEFGSERKESRCFFIAALADNFLVVYFDILETHQKMPQRHRGTEIIKEKNCKIKNANIKF